MNEVINNEVLNEVINEVIEKTLISESKWEVKLIGSLELVEQTDSRQLLIEYRDWLLGGKNLDWKVERTLDCILLMRK